MTNAMLTVQFISFVTPHPHDSNMLAHTGASSSLRLQTSNAIRTAKNYGNVLRRRSAPVRLSSSNRVDVQASSTECNLPSRSISRRRRRPQVLNMLRSLTLNPLLNSAIPSEDGLVLTLAQLRAMVRMRQITILMTTQRRALQKLGKRTRRH